MDTKTDQSLIHPTGEDLLAETPPTSVDTFEGKIHVEWSPQAAVTPLGQLPFFTDFLKTAGVFESWVSECPVSYRSPNAPSVRDLLGTVLLSVLSGHRCYAHITTIRGDAVNPPLLGMGKTLSEDSVRRAFRDAEDAACASWQRRHLSRCYEALLGEPWICDMDTTVKPLYGHQEGAEIGYNPRYPGRPSHVYHTYMMANTRLVLDVEVRSGKQSAPKHSREAFFAFLDELAPGQRPALIRGDTAYGNESMMSEAERRDQPYLFKVRQSHKIKRLIQQVFARSDWAPAGQGWEGVEDTIALMGWSRRRRVLVLRRELKGELLLKNQPPTGQLEFAFVETLEPVRKYEYAVLVTSLPDPILTLAQHYRDRADAENAFDELKNQWSWCGFTTQDLKRCQIMARHAALIYDWWSIFVRLAIPQRHAEAITSRPLLLQSVAKLTRHAGQTILTITSMHGAAERIRTVLSRLAAFLRFVRETAEQLDWSSRWRMILGRAFVIFLRGKLPKGPKLIENSTY